MDISVTIVRFKGSHDEPDRVLLATSRDGAVAKLACALRGRTDWGDTVGGKPVVPGERDSGDLAVIDYFFCSKRHRGASYSFETQNLWIG